MSGYDLEETEKPRLKLQDILSSTYILPPLELNPGSREEYIKASRGLIEEGGEKISGHIPRYTFSSAEILDSLSIFSVGDTLSEYDNIIDQFKKARNDTKKGIEKVKKQMKQIDKKIDQYHEEINKLREDILSITHTSEVYFRPVDTETKGVLIELLFNDNIPHRAIYSPKGTIFKTTRAQKKYLENRGLDLIEVELFNLGALSKEERQEIKDYEQRDLEIRREKALEKLRNKYWKTK